MRSFRGQATLLQEMVLPDQTRKWLTIICN